MGIEVASTDVQISDANEIYILDSKYFRNQTKDNEGVTFYINNKNWFGNDQRLTTPTFFVLLS